MSRLFSTLFATLLLGVFACDDDARPLRPAPSASPASTAAPDGGEGVTVVDPPAPAGDLEADIDGFTTVEACVVAHAGVDPLVGDALEAIGYDTLLRDACRTLGAARKRSTRPCDDILVSSLRARCVTTVAAIEGDADACPWDVPTRPERGRDPACLALASRDARPCMAVLQHVDRASCEAIVAHDPTPCARLPAFDRARCERDVRRWKDVLPVAPARSGPAPGAAHATATVAGLDDGGVGTPSIDVAQGVVLVERFDGTHIVLGRALESGSSFIAASPATLASLSLELVVPSDLRKAHVDGGELRSPGHATLAIDGTRSAALSVHVTRLERARGGAFEVTVSGTLRDGVQLESSATTYVRDVVKASALVYGAPRLGDAGGMR